MPRLIVLLVLAMLGSACGPSDAQFATARTATYSEPPGWMFDRAVEVAQENYKLEQVDPRERRFMTVSQGYSAEGDRESAGAESFVRLRGGSVLLQLRVEIIETDGGRQTVKITPYTLQRIAWSPQPRELAPDDPNLPPWIHGRVDALAYAIYERLHMRS